MSFLPRLGATPQPSHEPLASSEGGADACLPQAGTPVPQGLNLAAPVSLVALLAEFRPWFTARTFVVFCALACGFVAQTGRRTVCGMLVGARLSRVWSHHRAHRFFSAARWSPEQLTAVLARLLVRLLVSDGQAGGEGRDRRHAVSPPRAEGARRVLVPRRVGHRRAQGRLRQQLGHRRDRRRAALPRPPARAAGGFRLGAQGNRRLPAHPGPPPRRAPGCRTARPGHSCGGRLGLCRAHATHPARLHHLDHPAASSGTYSPTPPGATAILVPSSSTTGSGPNAARSTTSANSKHSATPSPSPQRRDYQPRRQFIFRSGNGELRCV